MPAIQQQRTNIKNAGSSTRKIIGKFNPLILGEVHTARNTRTDPSVVQDVGYLGIGVIVEERIDEFDHLRPGLDLLCGGLGVLRRQSRV